MHAEAHRPARVVETIIDVKTNAIDRLFTYAVPDGMKVDVGCAVRVPFGAQQKVAFVCALKERLSQGEGDAEEVEKGARGRMKAIEEVLTEPLFSAVSVRTARFLSERYVAPLSACIKLFFPAGAAPRIKRAEGGWVTERPKVSDAAESWVVAGPALGTFEPRKTATRQRMVLDAVREGDVRSSELRFLYGNVASTVKALEKAGAVTVEKRRRFRGDAPVSDAFKPKGRPDALTKCQGKAMGIVDEALDDPATTAVLIDGVTGSGKTEVYLRAIEAVIARGQGAIVLVPEISLTPQTVARFRGRFGDQVAVMHSKMSAGERYDQWDMLRRGAARIVVGARSALFMPVQNVGLIVIDEEHETTYKQESAPRYVTRDVACWMARERSATVLLGSATPSIESLYLAKHDPAWRYAHLPERANGRPLPPIEVIDMALEFRSGARKVFSKRMAGEILKELKAGHKVVLLLNQRGFARFLLCRDCGFVPECRQCSTTLTFHEKGNRLICHHCGYAIAAPPVCPSCGSPYLKRYGVGTERVEAELAALLEAEYGLEPQLDDAACHEAVPPVIRMDADTTAQKGAHQRLLEAFAQAPSAVLLGTQMIAKGLDFDDVTLVGVINADTMLHLPDFRASERTFDLIQQVAGRAGRAELPGRVLVQTYEADSVAIRAAAAYDRRMFLNAELPKREAMGYPPFVRIANVLIWGRDGRAVEQEARRYQADLARSIADEGEAGLEVLPASPCAFERIRNMVRWHIVVKAQRGADLSDALGRLHRGRRHGEGINTAVDIDPMDIL